MEFNELIDNAYRDYAQYKNYRTLPNYIDGLKTSSRKVIFTAIDMNLDKIKVSGLANKTTEKTCYKHGEVSLEGVIVGLAQSFPGSNNVALLTPLGTFGNVMDKEASSPRYIFTKLADNFYDYFNKDDLNFLEYLRDEGEWIEPKIYFPILPLILINGSSGVGNGYSCYIQSYDEKQIRKEIVNHLNGKSIKPLVPHINGYKGKITKNYNTKQITIEGIFERKNTTTIHITELPPCYDLEKYKKVLNKLIDDKVIKSYDNASTGEIGWLFYLSVPRELTSKTDEEILSILKLVQRETETIVVWDEDRKLKIFDTVEDLLVSWVDFRLGIYQKRKDYLLNKYSEELDWFKLKAKFILEWKKNSEWLKLGKGKLKEEILKIIPTNEDNLNRLLSLRITSLTLDEVNKLKEEIHSIDQLVSTIKNKDPIDFMKEDLK